MNTHITSNFLNNVTFLNSLEQSVIDALRANAEIVNFESGEVILREGDSSNAAWVVIEGKVQIYKERLDGQHLFLHTVQAGELFGEQALITGNKRNACARAQTPVAALRLPEVAFLAAISTQSGIREKFVLLGDKQLYENIARESTLLKSMSLDGGPSQSGRERVVADSQVLFREGDEASHIYVILSGRAAVYQLKDGDQVLLAKMTQGQTIGELALIHHLPRAATVIAEGNLRLYEIDADYFYKLNKGSEELRDYLQVLEKIYILPRRGFVTQYKGRYLGHDAFNTLYDLSDGTKLIASNVIGEKLCNLERVLTATEATLKIKTLHYVDESRAIKREIRLNQNGQIYGLTVFGEWSELPDLYVKAMDGIKLEAAEIEKFSLTGSINVVREPTTTSINDQVICHCINIKRKTLHAEIIGGANDFLTLQNVTSCGTVCGGCIPTIKELLGGPSSVPVKVREEIVVCESIRTFRLEPLQGEALQSFPGQHIILEAEIEGNWVRRPYTLSAPVRDGSYEVTIKRESYGRFSSWMFDERRDDMPLRISPPQGNYFWREGENPVVCLVAGIGVTPALAICRTIVDTKLKNRLHTDYSAHSFLDFAYASELTAATESFSNITLKLRATSLESRLNLAEIKRLHAELPTADYFLCGPQGYIDSVTRHLQDVGIATERVHTEVFVQVGSGPIVKIPNEKKSVLRRKRSGEPDLSLLFIEPKPQPTKKPPNMLIQWLANFDSRYSLELIFAGKRIAPFEAFINWCEYKLAGVDPHLPSDHLAFPKLAILGQIGGFKAMFKKVEHRVGSNREIARKKLKEGKPLCPNTPDGLTFTSSAPSFEIPQIEEMKPYVDTVWRRTSATPGSALYITRSPTAARYLLCGPKTIDRGSLPNHYFQKAIGHPDLSQTSGCKAGGLLIGQYHDNKTWKSERNLAIKLVGSATLNERTESIKSVIEDICNDEIDLFIERHPNQIFDGAFFMEILTIRVALYTTLPGVDEVLLDRLGCNYLHALLELTQCIRTLIRAGSHPTPKMKKQFMEIAEKARAATSTIGDSVRDAHARGELTQDQINSSMNHYILFGENGESPNNNDLTGVLGGFLGGASESTGHSMAWALYELGRNPELYKNVQKEVDAFNADHNGQTMTPNDYDERPITLAFIYELQRLHTGLPFSPRQSSAKGVVPPDPETGIGSFEYPNDAFIIIALFAINLDPETFSKPNQIHLEHFFEGITPSMKLREQGARVQKNALDLESKFRYLPFSAGPASCPGRGFNKIESILIIDSLMRRYDFSLVNPEQIVATSEMKLLPGPMPGELGLRIRQR